MISRANTPQSQLLPTRSHGISPRSDPCLCRNLVSSLRLLSDNVLIRRNVSGDHARGWRAIGLPFFFLGSAISVMALKRVCAVIWLL